MRESPFRRTCNSGDYQNHFSLRGWLFPSRPRHKLKILRFANYCISIAGEPITVFGGLIVKLPVATALFVNPVSLPIAFTV